MRALVVPMLLAVVVVVCMAFATLIAGLDLGSAGLASIALGLFAISAIFAAIAALGPKARPTPFLTPTIAGMAAAVMTTALLIAVSTHMGQADRSVMRSSEPAKIDAPSPDIARSAAVVAEPKPELESSVPATAPEPIPFPEVTIMPVSSLASSQPESEAGTAPDRMAEPSLAELPQVPLPPSRPDVISVAVDSGPSSANATTPEPATSTARAPSQATPTVPIPPIPSPAPTRLVLSEDRFDTSKPPPLPNGQSAAPSPAIATTIQTTASPPLPRIRPCGADEQLCP